MTASVRNNKKNNTLRKIGGYVHGEQSKLDIYYVREREKESVLHASYIITVASENK